MPIMTTVGVLVENAVVERGATIAVLGEGARQTGEIQVNSGKHEDQRQFRMQPRRLEIIEPVGEQQAGQPDRDHRRVDDSLEQPSLHDLERLRQFGPRLRVGVIDKKPRQVEHSRHQRYDGENMQRLDPKIRRVHGAQGPIGSKAEILRAEAAAKIDERDIEVRSQSVVFRAFPNPRPDGVSIANRQLLLSVRHTNFRRDSPIEQAHQVACFRIAGNDHGAKFGALHHTLI